MNFRLLLLAAFLLAGCSGPSSGVLAVGRKEATRLRECYNASPEKHSDGVMHVASASLSIEARAAGFRAALIDADSEMLMTFENKSGAKGLLFNYVSGAQLWDLEDSGYSFKHTKEWDILRFVWRPKKSAERGGSEKDRGYQVLILD